MHSILIRNNVYNVLRVSLNRNTVTTYHMCVKFFLPKFISEVIIKRYSMCELGHIKLSHLKFKSMWSCICLIGDCKRAVKISTCQIQMRSWPLKGLGDDTLIGLLHVTPKPHLRVIRLLQTLLDLRRAQESVLRR